jgi:Bifunctional DNA primase/polymerase, N-terminal
MLRDQTVELAGISLTGSVGEIAGQSGQPPSSRPKEEVTSIRLRLRDAGYTPVPAEGKACRLPGWNRLVGTRLSDDAITGWEKKPAWSNTGILCGAVRVIDIDIDEPERASEVALLAESILGAIPPARVGRAPRMALFVRSDDPLRRTLKVAGRRGTVEFLGHGSQVIVDGIHPSTNMPYQWERPLMEFLPKDLPLLDAATEGKLVEKLREILGEEPAPDVISGTGSIQNGRRNDQLWRPIARAAYSASSEAGLMEEAMRLNEELCEIPEAAAEIRYKVNWAWKKKLEGQLWVGTGGVSLSRDEYDRLGNPDALFLLVRLRFAHGARMEKRFALSPTAMTKSMKMSRQRLERARDHLVRLGFVEQVTNRRFRLRR